MSRFSAQHHRAIGAFVFGLMWCASGAAQIEFRGQTEAPRANATVNGDAASRSPGAENPDAPEDSASDASSEASTTDMNTSGNALADLDTVPQATPETQELPEQPHNLRATLSVGGVYDTHGDGGALMLLRLGHRFRLTDGFGIVVSGAFTPMVVVSNNDAHNRTAMGLDVGLGFEILAGIRWTLTVAGGSAVGATQTQKLSSGAYFSTQLDAYIPLNSSSGALFGTGFAWVQNTWERADSATLLHVRVGFGWSS